MPYIKKEQREKLARGEAPSDAGELYYKLTREVLDYLGRKGRSYGNFNEVMGVLGCVTQEIYRRFVTPYEEEKIKENGDVQIPTHLQAK